MAGRAKTHWRLTAILAAMWAVLGSAALDWPGTESESYRSNLSRVYRMNQEHRRTVWLKYHEFLALPKSEQERLRRLHADLQKLPPAKRDRYRGIMDRYVRWKKSLPLYQQQMLEAAAKEGATELYNEFRAVQGRKENEDRTRDYWFVPDAVPGMRKAIPRILAKLSLDEIEELDQAPPLDRTEKLLVAAQRVGLDASVAGGPGALARPWLRGPFPPPDPEKFQNWLQTLPREQLEELGDLSLMKKARERQLFQLYYRQHQDELRARLRKGEGVMDVPRPNERMIRPKNSDPDRQFPAPDRRDPAKQLGIPSK